MDDRDLIAKALLRSMELTAKYPLSEMNAVVRDDIEDLRMLALATLYTMDGAASDNPLSALRAAIYVAFIMGWKNAVNIPDAFK